MFGSGQKLFTSPIPELNRLLKMNSGHRAPSQVVCGSAFHDHSYYRLRCSVRGWYVVFPNVRDFSTSVFTCSAPFIPDKRRAAWYAVLKVEGSLPRTGNHSSRSSWSRNCTRLAQTALFSSSGVTNYGWYSRFLIILYTSMFLFLYSGNRVALCTTLFNGAPAGLKKAAMKVNRNAGGYHSATRTLHFPPASFLLYLGEQGSIYAPQALNFSRRTAAGGLLFKAWGFGGQTVRIAAPTNKTHYLLRPEQPSKTPPPLKAKWMV